MDPLFQIPEDIAALSADQLTELIESVEARLNEVAADPASFVTDERTYDTLRAEVVDATEALNEARGLLATLEAGDGTGDAPAVETPADEPAAPAEEPSDPPADDEPEGAEAAAADIAALATGALERPATTPPAPTATAAVTASAGRTQGRPARARNHAPQEHAAPTAVLTAAVGPAVKDGGTPGTPFDDELTLARAMIRARDSARGGFVSESEFGKIPVARAEWSQMYGDDRTLMGKDEAAIESAIRRITDPAIIRANFEARRKHDAGSLTASGGLCAPVTPYYNLQMISVADRPVRAALPAFNADRGGIRAARPASLASVSTGVGAKTVAQDQAGGTTATKTCQTVDCPGFYETDVEILFHCLRFGNLGARTFPELLAQWNNLVLSAHARLGDRTLLTQIDTGSTAVTAASLGLGASADLLSQVLVAAAGMRSRHRMDPEAVLRVMLPKWVQEMFVSDVYRSQFQRFEMTADRFVSLLRAANVEPSFYIDSAAGKGQEFGVQSAGALLSFPNAVTWYLFPEGSWLYLDGGILELGLVRDSVLNSTNDFQIFGESFENVAFIGVESLAITSTVCDSGITAGTHNPTCPIDYTSAS